MMWNAKETYCINFSEDFDEIFIEVKMSRGKIVPYSNLQVETVNINFSKVRKKRITIWNVR